MAIGGPADDVAGVGAVKCHDAGLEVDTIDVMRAPVLTLVVVAPTTPAGEGVPDM
jgi:hypothetical protein